MRVLGVTETCDLGALYLRLQEEGHDVRVAISDPLAQGTLAGMVPRAADWRAELEWVRDDGVIVFEAVSEGFGALQDGLRRDGLRVVGGSAYGDRLENDRAFAQALFAEGGFPAGHVWDFTDREAADRFIAGRPARYVLKFNENESSSDNYVGQLADGSDVRAMLAARGAATGGFILMEHVEGVQVGVGAYFDGTRFLTPACLDWEHKRFFTGDMGELTGEMGTVATFDRSDRLFRRVLQPLEPRLRAAGHHGYINVNMIANAAGLWPLEFTCRFGYPGFAVLEPLQATPWGELLRGMADGDGDFATHPGFSTGIVVTTPPFPYTRKEIDEAVGLPLLFDDGDRGNLHFGEVGLADGRLVTSGLYGWTMVVTGTGATIDASRREAYSRAGRVFVPNMRYRLDIGDRLIARNWAEMEKLDLLDPPPP